MAQSTIASKNGRLQFNCFEISKLPGTPGQGGSNGVFSPEEMKAGILIRSNDDADCGEAKYGYEETASAVPTEDDLYWMRVVRPGAEVKEGTLKLTRPDDRVQIWKQLQKGNVDTEALFTSGNTASLDLSDSAVRDALKSLWLEGRRYSTSVSDIELTAEYEDPDGDGKGPVSVKITVLRVDLDVDTERTGGVSDRDDDAGEDRFTRGRGAVLLVNSDRDGGRAASDNEDGIINGDSDRDDVSQLVIRRCGPPSLPAGMTFCLRVPIENKEHIRIFDGYFVPGSASEFMAPENGECREVTIGTKTYWCRDLDPAVITGTGPSTAFSAEGLKYPFHNPNGAGHDASLPAHFDGQITVELALQRELPGGGRADVAVDRVHFQVAPLVFSWNGQAAEAVYAFGDHGVAQAIQEKWGHTVTPHSPTKWLQDEAELANTAIAKNTTQRTVMPVIANLEGEESYRFPVELRVAEQRYGYLYLAQNPSDGGDIEVTPPLGTAFPLGRVVMSQAVEGDNKEAIRRLVRGQKVQVAAGGRYIALDTSWLVVGHVDEVVCFVPHGSTSNYSVLVPSPRVAFNLLHDLVAQGWGDVKLRVGCNLGTAGDPGYDDWSDTEIKKIFIRDDGAQQTTLKEGVDETATTLKLNAAVFPDGPPGERTVILRVDNEEYVEIAGGWGTDELQVTRARWDSQADVHVAGSLIYAPTVLMEENVYKYTLGGELYDGAQREVDGVEGALRSALGPQIDIIELPVIFKRKPDRKKWLAYTSNLVNCLVAHGKAVMPATHGPVVNGVNKFEDDVKTKLGSMITPEFVDVWERVHMYDGEVHCCSNARRAPLSGVDWWQAQAWPE